MKPVPVADGILESKFFGLPLGKLLQSIIPTLPAVALLVLQVPWTIYSPPLVVGAIASAALFNKTPPGQMPSDYLFSWLQRFFRPDDRYKTPQNTDVEQVLIQDGGDTIERSPPAGSHQDGGLFSANTIDDVPIEGVHEDGVIETERAFTQLIDVRPAVWSQQPEHQKESILGAYAKYLHTVDHPVQWVTYPLPLDIGYYQDQLEEAHKNRRADESDVIQFGRDYHAGWVDDLTSTSDLRERKFVLAVSSLKSDSEYERIGGIRSLLPNSVAFGVSDENSDEHLRQLEDRVETARSTLPQCGFADVSVVDDRESVLRLLRLYYREKATDSAPAGITGYDGDVASSGVGPDSVDADVDPDTLTARTRDEQSASPDADHQKHPQDGERSTEGQQ